MKPNSIVAIVDDEQAVRAGLGSLLRSADLTPELFASAESLLDTDLSRYGCVLTDVQMPGRSGLELLATLKAMRPHLPVLVMTAFPDDAVRERADAGGAACFLVKPCDPDRVIALVETLLGASGSVV